MQSISNLYCITGVCCCGLHVNNTVYKHFDRSKHVGSSDPTSVQNIRPLPLMAFEIPGLKLKKDENKNGLFPIIIF